MLHNQQASAGWHIVSATIPFPSQAEADLVAKVIAVDALLKPSVIQRSITVAGANLCVEFQTAAITYARVAMDHCLSNVQLIVQTMHRFPPLSNDEKASRVKLEEEEKELAKGQLAESERQGRSKMEIGLMGSWGGVAR